MPPCQLGQMHQTLAAANIDECAEVLEADDLALADIANAELGDQGFLALLAHIARGGALREDQAVAMPVDLHHLDADGLVHHRSITLFRRLARQAARAVFRQLALWHEAAQPPKAHDQAAFVVAADRRLMHLARFGIFFGVAPIDFFQSVIDRKNSLAPVIARVDHIHIHRRPDHQRFEHLASHQLELSARHQALSAIAQVNEYRRRRGFADDARIDLAPLEPGLFFLVRGFSRFCRGRGFHFRRSLCRCRRGLGFRNSVG